MKVGAPKRQLCRESTMCANCYVLNYIHWLSIVVEWFTNTSKTKFKSLFQSCIEHLLGEPEYILQTAART